MYKPLYSHPLKYFALQPHYSVANESKSGRERVR
jgi:hypothetical protein